MRIDAYFKGKPNCAVCGTGLSEVAYARGGLLVCTNRRCKDAARPNKPRWVKVPSLKMVYAAPGTKCFGPGCSQFVPEGYYHILSKHFYCSAECRKASWNSDVATRTCPNCGKSFRPWREAKSPYCSAQCFWEPKRKEKFEKRCGEHSELIRRYMTTVVADWYSPRSHSNVRCTLAVFTQFMRETELPTFQHVRPKSILAFIEWCKKHSSSRYKELSALVTFFDWLMLEEIITGPNPLRGKMKFFYRGKPRVNPRPFSDEERERRWNLVEQTGDVMLLAHTAIAEEVGPRYSELLNLRMEDVRLSAQQIFVRNPTKNHEEGWVPFHVKTKKWLAEWLLIRPNTDVDFVFVNKRGKRIGKTYFWNRYRKIFGEKRSQFHRNRHTMTTRLVEGGADLSVPMSIGRWKSLKGIGYYLDTKEQFVKKSYRRVMSAMDHDQPHVTTKVRSMSEYMASRPKPKP